VPLLGRHVGGGPRDRSFPGEPGDPEVDELAVPAALDDDIGGLVVTVDDADGVCGRESEEGPL
jgi:hypothetical protein